MQVSWIGWRENGSERVILPYHFINLQTIYKHGMQPNLGTYLEGRNKICCALEGVQWAMGNHHSEGLMKLEQNLQRKRKEILLHEEML